MAEPNAGRVGLDPCQVFFSNRAWPRPAGPAERWLIWLSSKHKQINQGVVKEGKLVKVLKIIKDISNKNEYIKSCQKIKNFTPCKFLEPL